MALFFPAGGSLYYLMMFSDLQQEKDDTQIDSATQYSIELYVKGAASGSPVSTSDEYKSASEDDQRKINEFSDSVSQTIKHSVGFANATAAQCALGTDSCHGTIQRWTRPIYSLIHDQQLLELTAEQVQAVHDHVVAAMKNYYLINTHVGCTNVASSNYDVSSRLYCCVTSFPFFACTSL